MRTDDAIGLFSRDVGQFHALYQDRSEFLERLDIWRKLLDKYSVTGGLSIDMGCGTGVFSFYLAGKGGQVVGIDGAREMVEFCDSQRAERALGNVRFIEAMLPVLDETGLANADLVISSSVVEYLEDLNGALALFSRVLKPGGTLIVSIPNVLCINRMYERVKHKLTGEPAIYRYIRHFTSPRQLQRRVRRLHFELQEVQFYTHFTRLANLTRSLWLPLQLTEDLFVAVFRKSR